MNDDRLWHNIDAEDAIAELNTSKKGLSSDEAKERLERYGPNEIERGKGIDRLAILLHQIKNPLVVVLLAAAFISYFAGHEIDTIVILVVILFNTVIGYLQEVKAESAIQALREMTAPESVVIRYSAQKERSAEMRVMSRNIVPGDIVLLQAGDKVPADLRIFQAVNLEIDEAMLTGESVPVQKNSESLSKDLSVADRTNIAYSGTVVTYGRGKGVVVATGMQTEIGKIAGLIAETETTKTPLERQTETLSKNLGYIALVASITTVLIGLAQAIGLLEVFLFALAMAVSAIPEGLPVVMTITLAVGVNRMARRNAIIRRIQAVDTLGAVTTICTDKTGTLTTNQMTVRKVFIDDRVINITGVGYNLEGRLEENGRELSKEEIPSCNRMCHAITLCNDAQLVLHREEDGSFKREEFGDPTEVALLVAAAKMGFFREEVEDNYGRIDEIPFSSQEKYMATFNRVPNERVRVYVKGAPEVILGLSSHIELDGELVELTDERRERILDVSHEMGSNALRVLGMANLAFPEDELPKQKKAIRNKEQILHFIGLTGMIDPPRPEAKEAIELCRQAGIRVIMATGDHKMTALAIGKELEIASEENSVMIGEELRDLDDNELDQIVEDISIFARVSPEDKHRIVQSLNRKEHVTAMTGDGVNDAPALKAADIGISMGITGTDVTKETADMVLTDDNFASIVSAIEEGRVVFSNVVKVVKYLICTNVGEIFVILTALILLPFILDAAPLIFTPIQVLWVNLVTDGILDVSLAMEAKEGDVMHQPPRKTGTRIINKEILRNVVYVAVFMTLGTVGLFIGMWNGNLMRAQTIGFTTMAMFQVFNSLNCRSRTKSVFTLGFFSNKYLFAAIAASVSLQFIATIAPFFNVALGTVPLTGFEWLLIVLVASSVFVADEIRKFIQSRRTVQI